MGEGFHTYNIRFAKLPSISPVTFISQEEERKEREGKNKHVVNLTTKRQHPPSSCLTFTRFNFAEFRPTTRHGPALSRRYCRSFPGN